MKPDWKDAPEWAQYLAQDRDGKWYWYCRIPTYGVVGYWHVNYGGRVLYAGKGRATQRSNNTLEKRP